MRIIENRLTSGKDRSAALVLSLSDDNKKTLFSKLKEREIWTLSASMSNLGVIEPAVIKNVLMAKTKLFWMKFNSPSCFSHLISLEFR